MRHTAATRLLASSTNTIFARPLLDRSPLAAMALRRSARVNAISRPSASAPREEPTTGRVEPSKITKRGKGGRNPKPLRTTTAPSPPTPKRKRNGGPAKSSSSSVPTNRPADPHQTNAPLVSPETTRIVTYADELIPSGTKVAGPLLTGTTENILEGACAHLIKVDPKLKHVIDKHHCPLFSPEGLAEKNDPFVTLSSSIISQQV